MALDKITSDSLYAEGVKVGAEGKGPPDTSLGDQLCHNQEERDAKTEGWRDGVLANAINKGK